MTTTSTQFKTGHVGLNVSDLERSSRFYQEVFGFDVLGKSTADRHAFAFLGQNGQPLLTLWQQSNGAYPENRPGLHHLSFQVSSIEEVKDAERRIRSIGAKVFHDGIVSHGEGAVSGGVYFEDPDGIRLEIFAPGGAADRSAPYGQAPTCGFF